MEKNEVIETLRAWIKPGDTIYSVHLNTTRSGMYRRISFYIVIDGEMRKIDWHMIKLGIGQKPRGDNYGVGMGGCGMDMGFHGVYTLSSILFRDGFTCTGKGCPSNDHTNGDQNYIRHSHKSGGYALHHEWR
jgi:hypothetical protein